MTESLMRNTKQCWILTDFKRSNYLRYGHFTTTIADDEQDIGPKCRILHEQETNIVKYLWC